MDELIINIKNRIMKKLILIAIVAFALSSCGSTKYNPCPAYAGWYSGCGTR